MTWSSRLWRLAMVAGFLATWLAGVAVFYLFFRILFNLLELSR